jgi:HAD superfamily hydrolase (TIGR01549 family)
MIDDLKAVTFDFGNTLVPFPAGPSTEVAGVTAERAATLTGCRVEDFVRLWGEERLRQFAEDVPEGREADLEVRVARVLARLAGQPAPPQGERWDDGAVVALVERSWVATILDTYADAFARLTPVPPLIAPMLTRLAGRFRLGLLSNWPSAAALERFVDAAGWREHLRAVVVSQSVGIVKPQAGIFEAAAEALGVASGPGILHVGDDMGADVAGAQAVGWRTAWVRLRPADSPLPVAAPVPDAVPDLVLDTVLDLEAALGLPRHEGSP